MNILISIILTLAILASYITVKVLLSVYVASIVHKVTRVTNSTENQLLLSSIVTCLLWGLFYYLTH